MVENRYKQKFSIYSIENPEIWAEDQERVAFAQTKFLMKLFKKYGKIKSVLDVGCGVGSHVKALFDNGYDCVGVDANPAMIKYASKKYPEIHFEVQDMRTLNIKRQFDAIICINSIIVFNRSNEEVLQTFKRFFEHLKKNGILIIDVRNPISRFRQKQILPNTFTSRSSDITKFRVYEVITDDIDEKNQRMINNRIYYTIKGNKKVGTYRKESRLFFPQELKFFLETAGFKFIEFYSGELHKMSLNDKKLDKSKMCIVMRK